MKYGSMCEFIGGLFFSSAPVANRLTHDVENSHSHHHSYIKKDCLHVYSLQVENIVQLCNTYNIFKHNIKQTKTKRPHSLDFWEKEYSSCTTRSFINEQYVRFVRKNFIRPRPQSSECHSESIKHFMENFDSANIWFMIRKTHK